MSNLTEQYCNQIETALKYYLPKTGGLQERLIQSMTYSLLDGGKRIRPFWCWNLTVCAAAVKKLQCRLPAQ